MSNVTIDVDLDDDTIEMLVDIYIKTNMSSGSYELYKENINGFIIGAGIALQNEAILIAIKKGVEYANMHKT